MRHGSTHLKPLLRGTVSGDDKKSSPGVPPLCCLQSKPDMIANKELKVELGTPLDWQGHVPGVPIGTSFNDRGELAILGIHTKICAGIDCRSGP